MALLLILSIYGKANAGTETAWIVLNFKMPDGKPAQMAFDNPSAPNITLQDCEAALPVAQTNLIQVARQYAPPLQTAKFESAKCVMSEGDPIRPKQ